jgi:quercetin dioxygenase-like cupin family protein
MRQRARNALVTMASAAIMACVATPQREAVDALRQTGGTGGICTPVSERAGREFGCFITAREDLGILSNDRPVFWHVALYRTRAAANSARAARETVVESLGQTWLFTIAPAGWQPAGAERVTAIGPLPISPGVAYTAQYMEAVFRPGMKSIVHRHSGPEAWYTLSGATCLETPAGTMEGRAGGQHVIVPSGPPMELTATGTEVRRALVLILHDSSQPASSAASDWTPKGLCSRLNSTP